MLPFMIFAYILLGCIALYMSFALNIGFWSLLIFVYPTALFIVYFILESRLQKAREKNRQEEEAKRKRREASLNIIRLTTSNDVGCDFAQAMEDLDKRLEELGMTLHCDFSGYMT